MPPEIVLRWSSSMSSQIPQVNAHLSAPHTSNLALQQPYRLSKQKYSPVPPVVRHTGTSTRAVTSWAFITSKKRVYADKPTSKKLSAHEFLPPPLSVCANSLPRLVLCNWERHLESPRGIPEALYGLIHLFARMYIYPYFLYISVFLGAYLAN